MGDTFGAVELPVQIPASGETLADPALDVIGAFAQAVLNAYAGDAWAEVSKDSVPLVRTVQTNDPHDGTFNAKDLPALFLWRDRARTERLADDMLVGHDVLKLLWVPRPEPQAKRATRQSIFNAFLKALAPALERGRDPSWIKVGDTDPLAAERGSSLYDWAGLYKAPTDLPLQITDTPLTIQMDGSEPRKYEGLTLEMEIAELLTLDPSVHAEAPTSVQVDIDIDGLVVDESLDGN